MPRVLSPSTLETEKCSSWTARLHKYNGSGHIASHFWTVFDCFDIHATWIHMLIPTRFPASLKWVNELWIRRRAEQQVAAGRAAFWKHIGIGIRKKRGERRGEISVQPMLLKILRLTFCSTLSPAARLAQSVEHETLNLRVVGSSPTLGDQILLLDLETQT